MSDSPTKSEEEITRLAIQSLLEDARKFQRQRSIDHKNHEYSNGRRMAQRDSSIRGSKVEESEAMDNVTAKQPSRHPEPQSVEKGDEPKGSTGNGATVEQEASKASCKETATTYSVDDKDDILISLEKAIKGEPEEDDYDEQVDLQLSVEDDAEESVEKSSPTREVDNMHHDETTQDISTQVKKFYNERTGDDKIIDLSEEDKAASSADTDEQKDGLCNPTEAKKDEEDTGDLQPSSIIIPEETRNTEALSTLVKNFYNDSTGDDKIIDLSEDDKATSSADTEEKKDGFFNPTEAKKDEEDTGVAIQPSSIVVPERTRSTEYSLKDKSSKRKIDEDDDNDDDDDDDDDNLVIEISDSDSDSETYNVTDIKRARTSPSEN
ncbi:PREDICTED: serine-aspartate repeat-containing protein C-like isoform X2 [Nicrophorus vespilloides]|uniref:Serine-aspartate repeat-containing protein C-like isoform X2 n=1 Tax=Nicrophorus vespilloides TaxID=110193 RepID=A0ABM1NGK7_NICVS|nr:PREDICTED: serine-aspartate repeat-containing protein C-like isoform X2 [Nicrophorus vespilloides]